MSFLSSFFLIALPAAALPIIVHLLAKRRRTVIDWGAMQFLALANPRSKRSWRLKDLLLLLLRILALAAFILAFARPLIPAGWLGGHDTRDLIVVFDQSMSTGWDFGSETAYERQVTLLDNLFKDYSGTDFIRVLMCSERPEWLASFPVKAEPPAKTGLLEQVRNRQPSSGSASILTSVEEAWAAPSANPNAARQVVVITDGQAHGWTPEQSGRWMAIAKKANKSARGSLTRTLQVPLGSEDVRDNMAVTTLIPTREVVALGEPLELTATIKNYSDTKSNSSILHWRLGEDEELGLATVPALDPGASTSVKLEHSLDQLGVHHFHADLESGDGLAADNAATAIVEAAEGIPILVIGSSASAYLQAALGEFNTDEQGSVFRGTQADAAALSQLKLTEFAAIVLTDVSSLDTDAANELYQFTQQGGGLWICPDSQTDIASFNDLFAVKERPMAPVKLAAARGEASQRTKYDFISPPTQAHPATLLLSDTERLDLDEARLYRRFTFQQPLPADLSVLLRVGSGHPLVVEKTLGKGRIILQAVPLGIEWGNLPLLQAYVAMVYEWLWYITEPGLPKHNLAHGQPYEFSLPDRPTIDQVFLIPPNQDEQPIVIIKEGTQRLVRIQDTSAPGNYAVQLKHEGKLISERRFDVSTNPAESNIAPLDEDIQESLRIQANMLFGQESLKNLPTNDQPTERRQEPIWFWLLLGVIVFLVAESALACSIAKQRATKSPGANMPAVNR